MWTNMSGMGGFPEGSCMTHQTMNREAALLFLKESRALTLRGNAHSHREKLGVTESEYWSLTKEAVDVCTETSPYRGN